MNTTILEENKTCSWLTLKEKNYWLMLVLFSIQTVKNRVFNETNYSTIHSNFNFLQKWRKCSRIFHSMHRRCWWYQGMPLFPDDIHIRRTNVVHPCLRLQGCVEYGTFVFWPLPDIHFLISFVPVTLILLFYLKWISVKEKYHYKTLYSSNVFNLVKMSDLFYFDFL